jgi:hypothetical protein
LICPAKRPIGRTPTVLASEFVYGFHDAKKLGRHIYLLWRQNKENNPQIGFVEVLYLETQKIFLGGVTIYGREELTGVIHDPARDTWPGS